MITRIFTKSEKNFPAIIFMISFLAGCIFLLLTSSYQQMHDAGVFIRDAHGMAFGGLWEAGVCKEPGYSIVLAPLFRVFPEPVAIMSARFLNIILFSLSSLIFYLTIKMLLSGASAKRVFVVSLPFALSPQLASFSALRVYSEPLQLFLNSVVLLCLVRISINAKNPWSAAELRFWAIAGLAAGWLVITKSFFLIYPFWIAFFVVMHRAVFNNIRGSIKAVAKPVIVFLCISLLIPVLWGARNYKKFGYFMVAARGGEVLLCHTYLVEWGFKDSIKWGVFQLSDKVGKHVFPGDAARMEKIIGDPYTKAFMYARNTSQYASTKNDLSAIAEWRRLIKEHPFRYVWFYFLNSLNHVFFEGVYPDVYQVSKTVLCRYVYVVLAVLFHFLYSIFIWAVIVWGFFKYAATPGSGLLQRSELKNAVVFYSLGYFIFFAYHFHTEIRYFHPFYINVYLLFALSCNYLFKQKNIG